MRVRKELKLAYKEPESSYASLDFYGIGRVNMRTFLGNVIVQRLKIAEEDLIQWLIRDKIFVDEHTSIDFQHFKKKFFPDYYLIEEANEYELNDHKKEEQILNLHNSPDKQKEIVV